MTTWHRPLPALLLALCPLPLLAAAPQPPALPPPAPIRVHRAEGAIVVDGSLDDPGWKNAAVIETFYETSPGNNTPPAVKTTAWITYDDRYFYVGVRCDDPHPEQIRAPYVDRDGVIGTDDNIALFLDTRNERRRAMELRVNPRGIQADGIFNDANGTEDFSPDFYYDTAAKIDAGGWSAEFRIPFTSLRYDDKPEQTWNILVWRNYPRDFRYAYHSAPIDRGSNCLICHTHPIVGLTDLPKAGHVVAAPYVTSQQTATPRDGLGSPLRSGGTRNNAGLDVKVTPTADTAVDMTFHPDFSQIESDIPQITVNQRFAVFYPEKRPFFLEGFDLFDTPFQVAYTRTITSPTWGLRSTGKIGGSAYTALVTGDKGGGLTIIPGPSGSDFAPQDFKSIDAIGRMRHDFAKGFLGGVFTDREVRGGGHNRVIGPDFQWRRSQSDTLTGEALYSQTQNPDLPSVSTAWNGARASSHAASLTWNHQDAKRDWTVDTREVGRDFRADLGFIPQVGFRELLGVYGLRFFPEHSLWNFVRPSILVDQQWSAGGGDTLSRLISAGIGANGAKNMFAGLLLRNEQVLVAGRLLTQDYAQIDFQIDPSRRYTRVIASVRGGRLADFANARLGNGASVALTATVRPVDKLTLDANASDEWLDVAGGRLYTAKVERLKATYSFSNRSLVRVIGQYVTTERNPALYSFTAPPHSGTFLGSFLYSYKLNWQTVLFVGYGDDRVITASNDLVKADRSLFFKVSYAIQR
jgi:hypothetical protein